jgi:CheY-like chemotaxis protein
MNGQPAKPGLKITAAERPNTLGINQRDLVTLLQKIEAAEKGKAPVRRDFTRWPFRHATVKVTLVQPSGGEVQLRLACRNLSRGGISLLHNSYVHPGSSVVVSLPRLSGGVKDVPGQIKRCLFRKGVIHELGIQFDEPIDLREYLGAGKGQEFFSVEHVDPEKLLAKVLYIEDCDVDYRILQHFLRETNVSLSRVVDGASAMQQIGNGFELVIADWRLPDTTGTELVQKFRAIGIDIPVILVTADPVGLMKSGLWDLPNTGVLTKPLAQTQLLRAIAERLLVNKKDAREEAADDTEGNPVASAMSPQFAKFAETLEHALAKHDHRALVETALQIRGSAPSCGAHKLGKLADSAMTVLSNTNADAATHERTVKDLIGACRELATAA